MQSGHERRLAGHRLSLGDGRLGRDLAGIALLARHWGSVLQAGLSIASIVYGALLGVFLLGLLTKRVRETDAMMGMAMGLAAMIYVRFATSIAFTWYVLIGSAVTIAVGLAISTLFTNDEKLEG